jgi:hypothetical protein
MPKTYFVLPALLLAGCAASQNQGGQDVTDSRVNVPAVEFRTAFDGYRPFAEEEQKDWRRANEEVGAAGGHGGHRPGQGPGQQTSKPQPGKPAPSGGHGDHK